MSEREPREPRVQRLWLVRHGITAWNSEKRLCGHSDIPLSAEGQMQAAWVAQQLQTVPLSAIYTSDLLRAKQTAECIMQHMLQHPLSIPMFASPAWREISFGDWEGMTYAQVAQQFPQYLAFFTNPMYCTPPLGEPFSVLVQRVRTAFALLVQTVADNTGGDIVLISHGGPLRVLLCSLLALPFEQQWRLSMDHGSLSAIDFVPSALDVPSTVTLTLLNMSATLVKRINKEANQDV
jgi:broad specificity phosphatase PhoE